MSFAPAQQSAQAQLYAQQLAQQQQRAAQPNAAQLQLQQLQLALVRAQQQHQQALASGNTQQAHAAQQQLTQIRALQQAQVQQAQQAAQSAQAAAAAPAPAAGPAASGIVARERDLGDGDEQLRAAKRRKPTSRLLPTSFTPSLPPSTSLGASDTALSASLDALDKMTDAYKKLQDVERRVDWTVSRKKAEVGEAALGLAGTRGRQLKRTLRVHVTATLKDQPWQLSPAELLAKAAEAPSSASPAAADEPVTALGDISVGGEDEVKKEEGEEEKPAAGAEKKDEAEKKEPAVPRVEIKLTGEVIDDPLYPNPLPHFLHRLVLEHVAPSSSLPGSAPQPIPAAPISWTRPASSSSSSALPASFTSSLPTPSPSLPLRLSLYLAHPAGDRFTLLPELAHALDLHESDRVGVLEAVWAYARERGLVVGAEDGGQSAQAQQGGPKGGIKTDQRLAKFFGNSAVVPFHLLPEYLNRCLAAAQPRQIDLQIPISPDSPTEHHLAYDLTLHVPSPLQPALESIARTLSSWPASAASTSPLAALAPPDNAPEARELQNLDDKLALNCLAVAQHRQQLHLLLAFTRDPAGFLGRWVESQAGTLEDVLASSASGMGRKEGGAWKEELRRSSSLEDEGSWADEAARVLALRHTEGTALALRAREHQLAQQQVLGLQQQQGVVQQQQYQQQLAQAQAAQQQAAAAGGYGRR
ncbi:hypothetical protein JCM8097_000036 [Rhodosporidiobolus ruineniae]